MREEAIEKLNEAIKFAYSEADAEVCRMAIAALREQEERTCETCYGNDMEPDEVDNPCWNCKAGHSEWAPREQEEQKATLIQQYIKVPEKPQWISVEERLPERDEKCLCRYTFGDDGVMYFCQVLDYYATDPQPHFQHAGGESKMRVTHWMLLPEPPKEEV